MMARTAPVLFRHVADARVTAPKADLSTISMALEAYALHVGDYPTTAEGLGALLSAPPGLEARWRGPYVRGAVPKDPWGQAYHYTYEEGGATYELSSHGRDGRAGGNGEDSDITTASR